MRISHLLLAAAAITAAFAVETSFWTLDSAADFEKATLKRLALRSDGRLSLAPQSKELHDASTSYLWAVARDSKGTLYTGGGNPGATTAKLFATTGSTSKVLAELPGLQVQAIAIDRNDRVYAATAPDGKVYRVNANGSQETVYDPKAKYIWALAFDAAGNLYVATGDHGEIHRVTPNGQGSVFFKTEEEHARSLAVDSKGNLIVGTEPGGLVLRIDAAGNGFVLHQSGKREVTAVAVAADGSVYAAAVGNKTPAPAAAPPPAPVAAPISITVSAAGPPQGAGAGGGVRPAPLPPTLTPSSVAGGSELVRIAADGYPEKVWSDNTEIVYAIAFDKDSKPVLGTGNKGNMLRIDSALLSTRLVSLSPTQVTALTAGPDGAIYAATGNIGKLFQIGPALEADGTVETAALDAGWFAEWGATKLTTEGSVSVESRSGNLDRPQKNWSPWAAVNPRIGSPAARFLQLRATLKGSGAALTRTEIAYLPRNVAPKLEAIEVTPANYRFPAQNVSAAPAATLTLAPLGGKSTNLRATPIDAGASLNYAKGSIGARWKASDANSDSLLYAVEIRGKGEQSWKPLAEDLTRGVHSWDSTAFADGEYQLKVTASDAPDNLPGKELKDTIVSEVFVIDNTPPQITAHTARANGGKLELSVTASDALTRLAKAEYSINGGDWKLLEPATKLADARQLTFNGTADKPAGPEATVAIRVADANDNTAVVKAVVR